jgi:Family of unknown function (DUF5999)
MCQHQPPCPPADAQDREAAHIVASHPEQGWSLLRNGVVAFEDTGVLPPNGQSIPPRLPARSKVTVRLLGEPFSAQWPWHHRRPGGRTVRTTTAGDGEHPPLSEETQARTSGPDRAKGGLR